MFENHYFIVSALGKKFTFYIILIDAKDGAVDYQNVALMSEPLINIFSKKFKLLRKIMEMKMTLFLEKASYF